MTNLGFYFLVKVLFKEQTEVRTLQSNYYLGQKIMHVCANISIKSHLLNVCC